LSFSFGRSLTGRVLDEVIEFTGAVNKIKTVFKSEDDETDLWRTLAVGMAVLLVGGFLLVFF
jgi:hypothetical protein